MAARLMRLLPDDLLRAFRRLPLEQQGEFLVGLWRSMAEREDCSLVVTWSGRAHYVDLVRTRAQVAGNHMLISATSTRQLRMEKAERMAELALEELLDACRKARTAKRVMNLLQEFDSGVWSYGDESFADDNGEDLCRELENIDCTARSLLDYDSKSSLLFVDEEGYAIVIEGGMYSIKDLADSLTEWPYQNGIEYLPRNDYSDWLFRVPEAKVPSLMLFLKSAGAEIPLSEILPDGQVRVTAVCRDSDTRALLSEQFSGR